ncbi:hypothetical protein NDU88_001780 [Pleurodeles waltl]|uniref:Uncharacterized protein n=1 Tax=Pleurodeles waltl TaxID=8319 RepID=A0AAV7U7D7_PLEWA|nr:hypothetical protein NDU88_001780 [Pleurodeles waltl]
MDQKCNLFLNLDQYISSHGTVVRQCCWFWTSRGTNRYELTARETGVGFFPPLTPPVFFITIMAYYANEEEQYQELQEMPLEHQMEERLVEALGHHVQDSVNWELIQALKPFTQPLTNFAKREFLGERSQQHRLQTGEPKENVGLPLQRSGGSSSAEILAQMAASVLCDHAYGGFPPPQDTSSTFQQSSFSQSSFQDPSLSNSELDDSQSDSLPRKKQRKTRHSMSERNSSAGKNLLFSPEDIIHPRSTEWVPMPEVAHYVQDRLRKSFKKEVRNTLRSECPRPSLLGKVAEVPELDPSMATFLRKFAKGPKKGLDRAWRGCQDKLLDVSGPLTKILDLAIQSK